MLKRLFMTDDQIADAAAGGAEMIDIDYYSIIVDDWVEIQGSDDLLCFDLSGMD